MLMVIAMGRTYFKADSIRFLLGVLLLVLCTPRPIQAQGDPNYVAVVRNPVSSDGSVTTVHLYRGDGRDATVDFDKAALTSGSQGSYRFRNNAPRVPDDATEDLSSEPATLTLPMTMTAQQKTGIYTITVTENKQETIWRVIVTNENAIITFPNSSAVVSTDESFPLMAKGGNTSELRWRKNGRFGTKPCPFGVRICQITGGSDSEVFDCFHAGTFAQQLHAIMVLIFRKCGDGLWGPNCDMKCDPCINGGICSTLTGSCLCPPGFSGASCQNLHGKNVFGRDGEYKCDEADGDNGPGCRGAMICYPEPFGCICPAGYQGLQCTEGCSEGTYGAGCQQECHCQSGVSCANDTGVCSNDQCLQGWQGSNCQYCDDGYYPPDCLSCSCPSGDCSVIEASCVDGCAVPWTGLACDQDTGDGLIALSYTRVNPGAMTTVVCTVIRNPLVEEASLILDGVTAFRTEDGIFNERGYNRTTIRTIILDEGRTVTCSVNSTSVAESLTIEPFDLLSYRESSVLSFSEVTTSNITVSWPMWMNGTDNGDGPVQSYLLQYRKEGMADYTNVNRGDALPYTLSGLQPDTVYQFMVVLVRPGENGRGQPGSQQEQRTVCEASAYVPGNVRLSDESSRSLEFAWNTPTCSEFPANIEYMYELYQGSMTVASDVINEPNAVIEELVPYTNYTFIVRAMNSSGGMNSATEPITVTTSEDLPGPPNGSITNITENSLLLVWDSPREANGIITEYKISIRAIERPYNSSFQDEPFGDPIKVASSDRFYNLMELDPSTVYEVMLSAFTQIGEGQSLNFTENTAVYSGLRAPIVEVGDQTSATVDVRLPPINQTYATHYYIRMQLQDSSRENRNSSAYSSYSSNPDHYITAVITKSDQSQVLTVGDGRNESGYYNAPLQTFENYSMFVGVASKIREDISIEWADPIPIFTSVTSPPQNFTVVNATENTLTVRWALPLTLSGTLQGYKLSYRAYERPYLESFGPMDFTDKELLNSSSPYEITDLDPSTVYELKILANTNSLRGEPAIIYELTKSFSDLESPAIAVSDGTIIRDGNTATLTLPPLRQMYATSYLIRVLSDTDTDTRRRRDVNDYGSHADDPTHYIAAEVDKSDDEQTFTLGDGKMHGRYYNAPLEEGQNYSVFVGAASRVGEDVSVEWGDPLPIVSFPVSGLPISTIAGVAVAAAIILLIILIIVCWCCCRRSKDETKARSRPMRPAGGAVVNPSYEAVEIPSTPTTKNDRTIPVSELADYVKTKKASKEDNFFTEFETIPDEQLLPWIVAENDANRVKNRYGNILPYDDSRVVLKLINNDPHSDYINASYIDGYEAPKKFIASHGPNKASVDDFWRMVWQENVGKVVMLTPLIEDKKRKCKKYWPDDSDQYGDIKVQLDSLDEFQTYEVKTFRVSKAGSDQAKIVRHFHFTAWRDMKIPHPGPLLNFLNMVRGERSNQAGPTVVHCSAGVGRTGTYIALDAMLDMAAAEQCINVYDFVIQLRQQRFKSVQTEDQYEFIFDVLVKALVVGESSMRLESFRADLAALKATNGTTGRTNLDDQFQMLEDISETPRELLLQQAGSQPENQDKNRNQDVIPIDSHRPLLMTRVSDEGNDYINASFLSGYQKNNMFVATQMPLPNTVVDFWRLLWDYNITRIVMLNEAMGELDGEYWSETGMAKLGPFVVQVRSKDVVGDITIRKLEVCNSTLKYQNFRTITHIQCLGWPSDSDVPGTPKTLLSAVHQLTQILEEGDNSPILVHCMDGIGRTGMFCCLMSAIDQSKVEGAVDIFPLIQRMRAARPGMVSNVEQYQCILDAFLMYLGEAPEYQNIMI